MNAEQGTTQQPSSRWSCALVGDNALTAQCAQILVDRGHHVAVFVTDAPELAAWAAGKGLNRVGHGPGLQTALRRTPVDYLFSIANLRILPQGVLDVPRRLAINYHDGPLPRHAGLSATNWAVVQSAHGATEHGITWHVMTAEADAGDILLQQGVPLTGDDTTFTLNAKCFQAAIESFAVLVDSLERATVRPQVQDLSLRTYHGLADPPPDGGILWWTRTTAQLHALVRAADCGPHPNGWGAARLLGRGDFVLVTAASASGSAPACPPGTITGLDERSLSVATADGQLTLARFTSPDGSPLTAGELATRWGLERGGRLEVPDAGLVRAFADRVGVARPREAFWARRLSLLAPFDLPYRDPAPLAPEGRRDVSVPVPPRVAALAVPGSDGGGPSRAALAAVLAFLARVGAEEPFDVGLVVEDVGLVVEDVGLVVEDVGLVVEPSPGEASARGMFATQVPLRAPGMPAGPAERTFAGLSAAVEAQLAEITRRGTYLRDLPARRPELRNASVTGPLPVTVVLGDRLGAAAMRGHPAVIHIDADGTTCTWSLDCRAFGPHAADALAADFTDFLTALAMAPDDLALVPLLSDSRRRRVLGEWNDTGVAHPGMACVTEIIERQARDRADNIAVADAQDELTYRELLSRAGRVARELARRGVGPGDRVGVLMRRRADLLSALLGTLASGAAYVPLDPLYPKRRLEYMIADAGLALLLADPGPAGDLSRDVPVLAPDSLVHDGAQPSQRAEYQSRAALESPAYVIYTSGSTGNPKGVQVGHRALSNLLLSFAGSLGCGPQDRLLAVTTVCFDIAGLELLLPLVVGGRVDVAPQEVAADGFALRDLVERTSPTVMQGTPATWRILLAAGWKGHRGLRVLCGGEALPHELAGQLGGRVGELWNVYGPTETTIWSAMAQVHVGDRITIGRPIANTRMYVLDRRGQPVPPFIPGELYIAGDGVADGYLGRPDLTAQRFVPEGFRADGMMYRTGDIVRYLADGELEYLHRADNQVKVRGYRVELGEIEAIMARHPSVARCVVTVRDDGARDPWIAAYVVSASPAATDASELRRHAQAELPPYMVPAAFVFLDRIPLTDNGKVDRKALPAPVRERAADSGPPPGTDLEHRIARAWRAALPVGELSLDDNFFEVGGSSLTVVDVVARLREAASPKLTVVDMFRFPTIRSMAAHLAAPAAAATGNAASAAPDRAFLRRRHARLTG
jgi:polyketide synthase PksN